MIREVPLKRLATVVAGQSPPSSKVTEATGDLPFLQGNAEFGILNPVARYSCRSAPKVAEPGDILMSVRAPVGALNEAHQRFGIGRGLCAIRTGGVADSRFLWWAIHACLPRLHASAVGSTYDAVTADVVGSVRVPAPPIDQQRAIADHLDTETTRIDALITKKRRMIQVLDERFTSYRASELLRGLDPITGRGPLPIEWSNVSLGVCIQLQRGHDLPDQQRVAGDVPVISSGGVSGWHNEAAAQGPGVVTGRYGTIGDAYFVDGPYWPLNTTLYVRDFRSNDPRWVLHLLSTLPLDSESAKSAVTGINRNVIGQLRVALPAAFEQRAIANRIDEAKAHVDSAATALRRQIDLLVEHRQALITSAVTGELSVSGVAV